MLIIDKLYCDQMEYDTSGETEIMALKTEAIAAYKPFIKEGITHPLQLPSDDPRVLDAFEKYYRWYERLETKIMDSKERSVVVLSQLELMTFYVDAGFTDPGYLKEIKNELLSIDQELIPSVRVVNAILSKIKLIDDLLTQNGVPR